MLVVYGQKDNLDDLLKLVKQNKKVIVDFFAPWCGPCQMQLKVLDEFEKHEALIIKVNVDEYQLLPREYNVRSIPTLVLFENGIQTKKNQGFMSKEEIEDWLK